jgi:EmrB/QacA subfamily drug resistance transporter
VTALLSSEPVGESSGTTGKGLVATPYALRWVVLAVVLAADCMDLVDSTILNVAGPSIRRSLGGAASTLQWFSAAYPLAFAVLLVTGARLGDIFGRRRLFLIGSAGFTIASAACALANSPSTLIALRAIQGGFGALLVPQGFGMLKEVFAEEDMSTVFSAYGPVLGLSALAAPILAGVLTDANPWGTEWRSVFLINVPVGLFAFFTAVKVLPRGATHSGTRLDVPGMLLVGSAFVAIIYPLIQGQVAGWPLWMFGLLAAGLVLLGVFVIYEHHRRHAPLIEPSLLKNRTYISGIAVALAFFGAFSGLLLDASLFCQLGEHFSAIHAGLTLVPMTMGMLVGMGLSFSLAAKLGRHLLHIGIALVAAGAVALALSVTGAHGASTWALAPSLVVIGVGAGSSFGKLFDFTLAGVAMNEVGSASGVLTAVQQLAAAIGVAVMGSIFFSRFAHSLPTDALATTAWVCLAPAALAFLLVFRLPMQAREDTPQRTNRQTDIRKPPIRRSQEQ